MKGTEKQIKWAEDIKAEFLRNVEEKYNRLVVRGGLVAEDMERMKFEVEEALKLPAADVASFWISWRKSIVRVDAMVELIKRGKIEP